MQKVLLIDHHDSFIHNIVAWLSTHLKVDVLNVDQVEKMNAVEFHELLETEKYLGLILSPGPKAPLDYAKSLELEKNFQGPIFGICLGFQMMMVNEGYTLSPYAPPLHGKKSQILTQHSFFENFTKPLEVARYHSLGFQQISPSELIIAHDDLSHLPMVFYQPKRKRLGFQFHPESFLTKESDKFAQLVAKWFKTSQEVGVHE